MKREDPALDVSAITLRGKSLTPEALADRLRRQSKDGPNGCRLWTGAIGGRGYGVLSLSTRQVYAHRASYALHCGPIPAGKIVCHKCDVRNCINPDHFFLGTHRDNMLDKVAKGRGGYVKGDAHPLTILKAAAVRAIRASSGTHRELAAQYGVARSTISMIRLGLRGSVLEDPAIPADLRSAA